MASKTQQRPLHSQCRLRSSLVFLGKIFFEVLMTLEGNPKNIRAIREKKIGGRERFC